jgi:two-component system, cell cycle sensor histidine kinase and response regulator CckA
MSAKILIVEDEAIIADDIQMTLDDMGYETLGPVSTGQDALDMIAEYSPDLVLLDIRIRGELDGIDVANKLREEHPVPVIFLTAHADDETIQRAGRASPAGYLLKPFQPRELRAAIEIALVKNSQEAALLARERWFSTTLQSIGDAVLATDTRGRILFMNPLAEQLLGWMLNDVIGRPIEQVVRLVDAEGQPIMAPAYKALEQGLIVQLGPNTRLVQRDGAWRTVEDSSAPILAEHGELLGAVVIFRDVTEAREMERRLLQSERMAAIGSLAASMVHELNNPLSYVMANMEMARSAIHAHKSADATHTLSELDELLREAMHGAQRVSSIVQDLRNFARAETSPRGLIDLHHVIDEAIRLTTPQVHAAGALRREYGVIPYIVGDAGQLSQVFINILLNAALAIQRVSEGSILVRTFTNERGAAIIEISDNGPGILPSIQQRIFDPFFTTRAPGEGLGLGLSLSLNICQDHDGDITASSSPGEQTTFRVALPAAHHGRSSGSASAPSTALTSPEEMPAKERLRVLIVDDEPHVGRALERMLRPYHDAQVVSSAQDAMVELLAGSERFDAILTDLIMPGMTGMEFHTKLMDYNPELALRMLFMTGGAFTDEASAFLNKYPTRTIDKPFSCELLLHALAELTSTLE